MSGGDMRYELVKGELYEMPPAGASHGSVAMQIGALLSVHVNAHRLGWTFAAETGFVLGRNPDTVRAPDASFVGRDRLPAGELTAGFLELAPDLAVEVVSPGDREREVRDKVKSWLGAGTRTVWVLYPATHRVTVCQAARGVVTLSSEDTLDGGDVVPGFSCVVGDLFS